MQRETLGRQQWMMDHEGQLWLKTCLRMDVGCRMLSVGVAGADPDVAFRGFWIMQRVSRKVVNSDTVFNNKSAIAWLSSD